MNEPHPKSLVGGGLPCPPPGEGFNNWTFKRAWQLHGVGVSKDDAYRIMWQEKAATPEGRDPAKEINRSLDKAFSGATLNIRMPGEPTRKAKTKESKSTYPDPCDVEIAQIRRMWDGYTLLDLQDESPWKDCEAIDVLPVLFKAHEFVWMCKGYADKKVSLGDSIPLLKRDASTLGEMEYICPNPLRGSVGKTKEGKDGVRVLSNIERVRYKVIDFDIKLDENHHENRVMQVPLIKQLERIFPLRMVMSSGAKSLHAWFYVDGMKESLVDSFFRYACMAGADKNARTKAHTFRMPGGRRFTGEPQHILYFNPNHLT